MYLFYSFHVARAGACQYYPIGGESHEAPPTEIRDSPFSVNKNCLCCKFNTSRVPLTDKAHKIGGES